MTDHYWKQLPSWIQFFLLLIVLPGVVLHEYTHAIVGLFEGADSVQFDWNVAEVQLSWSDNSVGRWVWIAPTITAVSILPVFVLNMNGLGISIVAYATIQWVLLAYPSAKDINHFLNSV